MTNSKNTYLLAEIPKNPNDILSEMMLMEEIDASRTPIREALNMLSQEQLVQIIPKKGIMVLPLTMKEIAMTFEARLLMEPYIIENYSKYIDMDKLLELEEQTNKILSSEILERKDAVIFCTAPLPTPVKTNT